MPEITLPVMLFDADCGFCTKTAGVAGHLRLRAEIRSLQSVDLAALGVDAERAMVEMPFVAADGTVSYGHRGIAAALRTSRTPLTLVGRVITLPLVDRLARRIYRWVSEHRTQLPGGTPACALPNSRRAA